MMMGALAPPSGWPLPCRRPLSTPVPLRPMPLKAGVGRPRPSKLHLEADLFTWARATGTRASSPSATATRTRLTASGPYSLAGGGVRGEACLRPFLADHDVSRALVAALDADRVLDARHPARPRSLHGRLDVVAREDGRGRGRTVEIESAPLQGRLYRSLLSRLELLLLGRAAARAQHRCEQCQGRQWSGHQSPPPEPSIPDRRPTLLAIPCQPSALPTHGIRAPDGRQRPEPTACWTTTERADGTHPRTTTAAGTAGPPGARRLP